MMSLDAPTTWEPTYHMITPYHMYLFKRVHFWNLRPILAREQLAFQLKWLLITTPQQILLIQVMFSVVSVRHSIRKGSHVTIICNALDLTEEGSLPVQSWELTVKGPPTKCWHAVLTCTVQYCLHLL